jgi:hypothetical protein
MVNAINIRDTATVTNYYGLFLNSATVTGVLTNNWGVYQNDGAANNYFAGNVGVGTTSLTEKLEVSGSINAVSQANNFATGAQRAFMDYTAGTTTARFGHLSGASGSTTGVAAFFTNNTERMRIDSSGNVLVGTSGAIGKLAVVTPDSGYGFVIRGRDSDGQSIMSSMDRSGTVYTGNLIFPENGSILFGRLNTGTNTERMRITSTGNALLGTTVDFSTTTNAGNMAIAGVGIYPYTLQTGATNTTISSSLNIENLTIFSGNNGLSSQTYDGIISTPEGSNTGAGGTNFVTVRGGNFQPSIQSSGSAARVSMSGLTGNATRGNANDTSTASNNTLTGVSAIVNHTIAAGVGIVTGTATGLLGQAVNSNGTITTMYGARAINSIASGTTALSSSSTNSYVFSSESTVGASSGGGGTVTNLFGYRTTLTVGATGTVSNYYGLYLGTPTVTGTLTNRWAVYQDDAAAPNFFNGNVGIGTASPVTKLNISGSSVASGELGTLVVSGNTTARRMAMGVDTTSTMYSWIQSVESGVAQRDLVLQPVGGNVGIGTSSP